MKMFGPVGKRSVFKKYDWEKEKYLIWIKIIKDGIKIGTKARKHGGSNGSVV
jgi:hypothetical protein